MTDFTETDTLSTTIDTDAGPSAGGGGEIAPVDTTPEPTSLRDDLETVFREDKADKPEPKTAEKPEEAPAKDEARADEKAEKPEGEEKPKAERTRDEGGKFAAPEKKDEQQREERTRVEAPQSFLPKAKDVWRNTPHAVQAEVARMEREHAEVREQTRATVERYETLRQYDDLARSNGLDLRESLERMGQIEDLLQSNPVAGLNAILMEVGPRKADGQPFSLMDLSRFIAQQDEQNYNRMVAQPQQPPKEDPRVAQLQQRLAQVEEQRTHDTIIAPFAKANPRYAELEPVVAQFLQSGMVPENLSAAERLATAFDMAERVYPPSRDDRSDQRQDPVQQRRADEGFSGSQIKSSPGSVTDEFEPEAKSGESIRDSLRAEARRLTRA